MRRVRSWRFRIDHGAAPISAGARLALAAKQVVENDDRDATDGQRGQDEEADEEEFQGEQGGHTTILLRVWLQPPSVLTAVASASTTSEPPRLTITRLTSPSLRSSPSWMPNVTMMPTARI